MNTEATVDHAELLKDYLAKGVAEAKAGNFPASATAMTGAYCEMKFLAQESVDGTREPEDAQAYVALYYKTRFEMQEAKLY